MSLKDESFPAGTVSDSEPSTSPVVFQNRSSRQAHRKMLQHAAMFEELGMKTTGERETKVLLEDDDVALLLEYGLRRRLLSHIYNLRVNLEVASPTSSVERPYRLTLKTGGLVSTSYALAATGPAAREGQKMADRAMSAGILDDLVESVDLENLVIDWLPEAGIWLVGLEPYPGSYVHAMLPPIRYLVRLKEPEVIAVRIFLVNLSDVLRRGEDHASDNH